MIVAWKSLRCNDISRCIVQDRESALWKLRSGGAVAKETWAIPVKCAMRICSGCGWDIVLFCAMLRMYTCIRLSSNHMYTSSCRRATSLLSPPRLFLLRAWREVAWARVLPFEASCVVVPLLVSCYWICACTGRHSCWTCSEGGSRLDVRG